MFNYVIRRLLLMIPTFLGATMLVFVILQMAPGGPLEKTIMQIQMGASQGGGEGGATSSGLSGAGTLLPKRALKELERFYGFDKPIWQRYLIWLGVWEREIKHRTIFFKIGDTEVKKNMGKRQYAYVKKNGAKLEVYDKEGNINKLWTARFDMDISDEEIINFEELKSTGKLQDISKLEATIFGTEYSGLLTGKYNYGIPKQSRFNVKGYEWLRDKLESINYKKIAKVGEIAKSLNIKPSQLAILWCLFNKNVSSVILGASNIDQLKENLDSINFIKIVDSNIIQEINAI